MYINQNNFDWGCTEKELVIYVPNFGRKHLLTPTLRRFNTSVSEDRWMFLVVNDGPHEDMSDLEQEFNLKWFTFERSPTNERNGCMIRNFIIKRCMSKWLCTKDPEIICDQDIVTKVIDLDDVVYRPGGMNELHLCETQKILDNPNVDLTKLSMIRQWQVTPHNYQAFHNMVCIRTKRLQTMQGYEEEFQDGFGWEDVNLLERLKADNNKFIIDKDIVTWHIAHFIYQRFLNTINLNGRIYQDKKKNLKIVANENKNWGDGI